jgi:TonB-dependent starch-binding outer membrane protein SusC
MKNLRIKILLLFTIISVYSFGQTTLRGYIFDASNKDAIVGATISIPDTEIGTLTDIDGIFDLVIPAGSKMIKIAYPGFIEQIIEVSGQTEITVNLEPDTKLLDEVVVIGYQTINKRDVTGAVSSIKSDQFKDTPLTNAAEALTGRIAGVQLVSSEGAPGADIIVRVRGGSSITQDNTPIYIVDGIQLENALNLISPTDIESIDVLKDASSTAIYGARGANGVIIITTKSGKGGKTTVSYNGSIGSRELTKKLDVLNPLDFVKWQYERTRGSIADSTAFANSYGPYSGLDQKYGNVNPVDWQNEVFGRTAPYQNHNLSINGGSANTSYNLSLTMNKEDGIQLNSAFDRKLASFKMDHKASDKLKIGFNLRALNQVIDGAGTTESGTRTTNRLRHSVQYRPFLQSETEDIDFFDESLFLSSSQLVNPIQIIDAEYKDGSTQAFNTSGYLSYELAKNLIFKTTAGYDANFQKVNQFFSKITGRARNFSSLPLAIVSDQTAFTINNTNTLQYGRKIGEKQNFNIIIGNEIYTRDQNNSILETRYFPSEITSDKAFANMGLGSPPAGATQARPVTNNSPSNKLLSYFGRLNYNFDERFLVAASLRSDRSSKFSKVNGALVFPSGSLAWRFSNESFLKNSSWLSDGKLRLGFGTAGNNRIGDLLYQQLYNATGEYALNSVVQPGFATIALANPDLRWESNQSQNLGLDLAFFNNKMQLTIDAYRNKGKDLLLAVAIPPTTGYSSQIKNLGSTQNQGLELQLNAYLVDTKKFRWNTNFNISTNRNEILDLGPVAQQTRNSGWQGSDGTDDYLIKVGQPVGQMYGFVTDGFYKVSDFDFNATTNAYTIKPGIAVNGVYGQPVPGMLKWKDIDGDGTITADKDRTVIGNANPDFVGGLNNQFQAYGFDANIFVNFVIGNDIYNANKIEMTDGAFTNLNMLSLMKNRWTNINSKGEVVTNPEQLTALNANATIWSPVRVQRYWLHSWAVEDGSFLRINNLTLGYTLPQSLLKKVRISNFRIYGTVNNLATFTKYSGYDPEINTRRSDPLTQGVDFAGYPRSRAIVTGINLTF